MRVRSPRQFLADGKTRIELELDAEDGTVLREPRFEGGVLTRESEPVLMRYGNAVSPGAFASARPADADVRGSALTDGPPSQRPGLTVWLTGLSGAGKTTLAHELATRLRAQGTPCAVLDGDEIRAGLSSDLGLSPRDRDEQVRRTAHVAALIARSGVVAIAALISPRAHARAGARQLHETHDLGFIEVWVDTPLVVCEKRDPKGLYALARAGRLSGMTGVDQSYESPRAPELRTSECEPHEAEMIAARVGRQLCQSPFRSP